MSFNNSYYQDNLNHSCNESKCLPEKQLLLRSGNTTEIPLKSFHPDNHHTPARYGELPNELEREQLLGPGPVKLTPSWEEKNLPSDELNFKTLSLEDVKITKPPYDRCNLVYCILLLHGLGVLMPWNMIITAKDYYEKYKLNVTEDTETLKDYRSNFLTYIGMASQYPNLIFNFVNIFIQIGGDLTTRIVISILTEVVIFIGTIILAMIDTSSWPIIFFWITIASIIFLNMANGIYQSSIYGMAANLPMKYSNAVVLGSNICGTLVAIIEIATKGISSNIRTAAIYYFITALFILLACFDTYFALPLLRFYRYYERQAEKQKRVSQTNQPNTRIPYWLIFKKVFPQLWNVFFVFFVTLTIFPNISSNVKQSDPNFIIPNFYYTSVLCYLCFNFFAMMGSTLPFLFTWPPPRWLFIPVLLRVVLIPAYTFCNYQPDAKIRIMPSYINNDWAHFGLGVTLGLTSGYFSSLAMMYAPRSVESQHAPIAGMMAASALILGIVCGINFSLVFPVLISSVTF